MLSPSPLGFVWATEEASESGQQMQRKLSVVRRPGRLEFRVQELQTLVDDAVGGHVAHRFGQFGGSHLEPQKWTETTGSSYGEDMHETVESKQPSLAVQQELEQCSHKSLSGGKSGFNP